MTSLAPPTPRRTWVWRVISTATSAVVASVVLCAACEVYFRLRYTPSYVPDTGIRADRVLGWNTTPPVTPLPLNDGRGNPVVFLGDSFTDRKEWPAEAQKQLVAAGVRIDGYNLGVTGFGTGQQFLKFQQHAATLVPSAVVVLFFAWNDLRDNYPYPGIFYGPQRASRPYLEVSNGGVTVTPVRWTSALAAGFLRSEMYLRVFNRLSLRFDKEVVRRWPDLPRTLGWHAEVYYEDPVSWHPFYQAQRADSSYVKGAYDATLAAFKSIRDLAARSRAPLLVIGIDNAFTVDEAVAENFIEPFGDLDPSLPLARIVRLLENEGIAFINAQPELKALGERTRQVVYNGPAGGLGIAGHLQPEADRLIGSIAARWLATQISQTGQGRR